MAQKQPNAWGLYDMHGNIAEWCSDSYAPYGSEQETDPRVEGSPEDRVLRGGDFFTGAAGCRSAARQHGDPGYQFRTKGFRAVLESPHG